MKGFVYVDLDGNIFRKSHDYITVENPLFWRDNEHMIVKWWRFDTEDLSGMRAMLIQFKALQLKQTVVQEFLDSIGFDISTLKSNASKVQSG